MESCSRAAGSGTRLDRAALKGTSWAAGSCSHVTTVSMVEVRNAIAFILFPKHCAFSCATPESLSFYFRVWVLSDDADDWDLDVMPKPSEVQNDLYASNEDEEDEGEDFEGRKVTVRCCPILRF